MDPRTGQVVLPPAGANNTQVLIGTPVPGSGNSLNGIKQAGDGISDYGYTWPTLVFGPRFGAAYDISGDQSLIIRGGAGLFYDRPDGNTVFSIPGNPPIASSADLRNGILDVTRPAASAPARCPSSSRSSTTRKSRRPGSGRLGVQMSLPWASSLDVSYVGNRGVNRLGGLQGGNVVNLNAVDIGAAYLPANQNTTIPSPSTVPGANAYTQNLLRGYKGLAAINQNTTEFWDLYHSIQTTFQRRFQNGFSFGANYTLGLVLDGNTGLTQRLQHDPVTGAMSVRSDQAQYEDLFKQLNLQRHLVKLNAVWDMPDMRRRVRAPPRRRWATSSTTGSCRGSSPATPATGTTSATRSRTTART